MLGGFIILQCSQSAWYFPSLWRLLRVSKLGCDGVNPGESAMLSAPWLEGNSVGWGGPQDQTHTPSSPYVYPAPSAPQHWQSSVSVVTSSIILRHQIAFSWSFVPPLVLCPLCSH